MEGLASSTELADLAESLRQQGRYTEAWKVVERCLEQSPRYPRAILLRSRLLFQEGKPLQALESLRPLESILGEDDAFKTIAPSLEKLCRERDAQTDPAFVTESMAGLFVQQDYLLEALGIYRQLFLASGGEKQLWEKILFLRERLAREGSRDAPTQRVKQELELLDRWIQGQQKEA